MRGLHKWVVFAALLAAVVAPWVFADEENGVLFPLDMPGWGNGRSNVVANFYPPASAKMRQVLVEDGVTNYAWAKSTYIADIAYAVAERGYYGSGGDDSWLDIPNDTDYRFESDAFDSLKANVKFQLDNYYWIDIRERSDGGTNYTGDYNDWYENVTLPSNITSIAESERLPPKFDSTNILVFAGVPTNFWDATPARFLHGLSTNHPQYEIAEDYGWEALLRVLRGMQDLPLSVVSVISNDVITIAWDCEAPDASTNILISTVSSFDKNIKFTYSVSYAQSTTTGGIFAVGSDIRDGDQLRLGVQWDENEKNLPHLYQITNQTAALFWFYEVLDRPGDDASFDVRAEEGPGGSCIIYYMVPGNTNEYIREETFPDPEEQEPWVLEWEPKAAISVAAFDLEPTFGQTNQLPALAFGSFFQPPDLAAITPPLYDITDCIVEVDQIPCETGAGSFISAEARVGNSNSGQVLAHQAIWRPEMRYPIQTIFPN